MTNLQIRRASQAEFETAINWAADEGWNPGLDDLPAFHATDPQGFLMGWQGDKPVSCISVVRYGMSHGFLGFYIVHPDWRGSGIGMATWNAGMAHLDGRIVGLDGVVEQQQNYARSGFEFAGTNIRFTGVPAGNADETGDLHIRPITEVDRPDLLTYQKPFFPADRDDFMARWALPSEADTAKSTRQSLAAIDGERMIGFGTIRECRDGYKVGPLFADNEQIGTVLFQALCNLIPATAQISLDVPEENLAAMALAARFELKPVFQTARMWKGKKPDPQTHRTFGISTFELG